MTEWNAKNGSVRLVLGDCMDVLKTLDAESLDCCVTDPPYALTGASRNGSPRVNDPTKPYGRHNLAPNKGFMGQTWDGSLPTIEHWQEVLRVLKPGAHLLAFGGTRTHHRLMVAIEDAGFEIRDCVQYLHDDSFPASAFFESLNDEQKKAYLDLHHPNRTMSWTYGSGFPKSLNVSAAIDREAGAEREVIGRRTDGRYKYEFSDAAKRAMGDTAHAESQGFTGDMGVITAPATDAARQWSGFGTALKPSWEPVIVARKPLAGTVAQNVQKYGTGALNIEASRVPTDDVLQEGAGGLLSHVRDDKPYPNGRDGEASAQRQYTENGGTNFAMKPGKRRGRPLRVIDPKPEANGAVYAGRRQAGTGFDGGSKAAGETTLGRWPANTVHDGSDEVAARFPDSAGQQGDVRGTEPSRTGDENTNCYGEYGRVPQDKRGDEGSAARFFYCAKTSSSERGEGNRHPTVKPLELMRFLCRLCCPPGGTILDPFAGSGTTLLAASYLNFRAIGIEREQEWFDTAVRRMTADTPLFE